jgi:aminopeptidase N
MLSRHILSGVFLLVTMHAAAQLDQQKKTFTRADTLRGSLTEFRRGWDVTHYDLDITVDIYRRLIKGSNVITYNETLAVKRLQIDLQAPLIIDSIISSHGEKYAFEREGNAWFVRIRPDNMQVKLQPGIRKLKVYYHGIPKEAVNAPWDGGLVWKQDKLGNPFIATAVQGLGASAWWPCKDHQSDEPDNGMTIRITAPDTLSAISNGRLKNVSASINGNKTWTWKVENPINTYNATINIGKYVNWTDTLNGEAGKLDLSYWVLKYNLGKAKKQFEQVKPMLRSFEYWFGKYPWYEDGYKLVETPFLGMEHQSAIAYGNGYENGYRKLDLSGTNWGSKWDFIVVHESGHEWFGNNITTKDIADMWVHEGFTSYSETLFTESYYGKDAADEYCYGLRRNIKNDVPIIGTYGVNEEGSGDMYYKASNMLHSIRKMVNDDVKFRNILRGLNDTFYHKTVTTQQVEEYISNKSGINLSKVFSQYLRTTQIPQLEYYFSKNKQVAFYRWTKCIAEFDMPLVLLHGGKTLKLLPQTKWNSLKIAKGKLPFFNNASIEKDYYITVKQARQ